MAYTGLYNADGQQIVVIVSGASYTGLYNADGSYNGVLDITPTVLKGAYHACGAYNVQVTTNPFAGPMAPDGSRYILGSAGAYVLVGSGITPAVSPSGTSFLLGADGANLTDVNGVYLYGVN